MSNWMNLDRNSRPPTRSKVPPHHRATPSKIFLALVSLAMALLSSVSYNIYQFTANSRLSNNDIKFRYIKAVGEITPQNLLKLETIFEYEPNKQKQCSIRQMVEEYEQRVEQRARELEEAHLREAESIKQKR